MAYFLGIDLGTTYTAAACWRDRRASIARLGSHSAEIPSVVLLKEDGEVITGEAAERRVLIEPHRVAREFKRRIGDPTPLFLGDSPCSAETLMAKLLRWVVDKVAGDEGGLPSRVAVTHPANWGDYKKGLLQEALRLAELPDVTLLVEPEAAAIHYASLERIEPGSVLAVYDLGGGTFDAAVLRRTEAGWDVLGQPEGVDRLGGIDFDAAVLHHVALSIGEAYDALDPDDPPVLAAAARLRRECVSAKEALASDTDVAIPVLLPHLQSEVRLTRGEFEAMIRPSLAESILALKRALRSAAVEPDGVNRILLVGGSSRIPLVGQMVGSALGRPIAVDAHPKHGVALGAAIVAAREGHEPPSTGVHAVRPEGPAPSYAAHMAATTRLDTTPSPAPAGADPSGRPLAPAGSVLSDGPPAPGGPLLSGPAGPAPPGAPPAPAGPLLSGPAGPVTSGGAPGPGGSGVTGPARPPPGDRPPGRPVAPAVAATAAGTSTYQVPALAPGAARRPGGVAAPARPAARGRSPGAPPRPTLALLAWGCTLLATVVLVSLLLVIGGRDADATGDGTPDTPPPTAPGHPGPAAISSQPGMNGGAPTTPVPGVTTTLPVVTTTATSRATTTTAPTATTTTASAPTTTEPPPPSTTEPPPPSTTEPPTPTTTEPVATGSARQLPPD